MNPSNVHNVIMMYGVMLLCAMCFALYVIISNRRKKTKPDSQTKFPFERKLTAHKH